MLVHTVAVLHAPHHKRGSLDPPQHVRQWWKDARLVLDKYPPTIVLTDANARMGSDDSRVRGAVGPRGQIDYNGLEFQKLAQQCDVRIAKTFIPHDHPETFRANAVPCTGWIILYCRRVSMIVLQVVMSCRTWILLEDHQTIGRW
eukprot:996565-Pyramimonas_sp.AAC.1